MIEVVSLHSKVKCYLSFTQQLLIRDQPSIESPTARRQRHRAPASRTTQASHKPVSPIWFPISSHILLFIATFLYIGSLGSKRYGCILTISINFSVILASAGQTRRRDAGERGVLTKRGERWCAGVRDTYTHSALERR